MKIAANVNGFWLFMAGIGFCISVIFLYVSIHAIYIYVRRKFSVRDLEHYIDMEIKQYERDMKNISGVSEYWKGTTDDKE